MAPKSSQLALYESETASTLLTETVTGSHRLKVVGYSLNKGIGLGNCLASAPFNIGGYSWFITYYPDGQTESSKGYLGFHLHLLSDRGEAAKVRFNFTMLDQNGTPSTLSFTSFTIHTFGSSKNVAWGFSKFVERETFETSGYLKNDSFMIVCTIIVVKPPRAELTNIEPIVVPPSNLDLQLVQLLESGKGADVTFEVHNKLFKAHKCVLAARSLVFSAQFFGSMNEKGQKNVKLEDIEPEAFKILLHFIYSDSVPELAEDHPEMYQHLLVVADRYGVERLKSICENKLSKSIEIKNLATTLTLAEQHNCSLLKTSCFKFISTPEILADIMETDGFEHLSRSCPFILKDLVENLRSKKRILF